MNIAQEKNARVCLACILLMLLKDIKLWSTQYDSANICRLTLSYLSFYSDNILILIRVLINIQTLADNNVCQIEKKE